MSFGTSVESGRTEGFLDPGDSRSLQKDEPPDFERQHCLPVRSRAPHCDAICPCRCNHTHVRLEHGHITSVAPMVTFVFVSFSRCPHRNTKGPATMIFLLRHALVLATITVAAHGQPWRNSPTRPPKRRPTDRPTTDRPTRSPTTAAPTTAAPTAIDTSTIKVRTVGNCDGAT